MLGPTGIGVLYGKESLLHELHPAIVGGGTIIRVSTHETTYRGMPAKFEAGTPNIAGAIGLARAITYLETFTIQTIYKHSQVIASEITKALEAIPDLTIVSEKNMEKNIGLVSFFISGINPHHLASYLDEHHIAVRAGHHCAMPLAAHIEVPDICRASCYLYNDLDDVKKLVSGIKQSIIDLQ
jgi:cysteine desulfurase/selenocysteine lyase